MDRRALVLLAMLLGTMLSACAPMTGRAAETATRRAAAKLTVEQTQEDVAAFLRSPSVRSATEDLGESAGRGMATVVSDHAPLLADRAVDVASSEATRSRLAAIAGAASREIEREIAMGIERSLGPATARTIRRDVGPAIAEIFDERMDDTLARSARTVSREAVLGSHEGLTVLGEQPESLVSRGLRIGRGVTQLVILGAGIALGVLFALLVQSRRAARRERARSEDLAETLSLLRRSMRAGDAA